MQDEEAFIGIFARNCSVIKINRRQAEEFLSRHHRLGYTNCRYFYGLFIEKPGKTPFEKGTLAAVAGFSGPRRWEKGGRLISSYEWVRYASMPGTRAIGGMGKILKTFIEEVKPDDIMSYADKERSEGDVYKKLGFIEEGVKTFGNGGKSVKFRLKISEYE